MAKRSMFFKKQEMPNLSNVIAPEGMTPWEAQYTLNILQGYSQPDAYREAYKEKSKNMTNQQISQAAYRHKLKPIVQEYMQLLLAELERSGVASALDLQVVLTAAIFTPISEITADHPLCQKVKRRYDEDGNLVSEEFEMVSKIESIKALSKMRNYDAPMKIDVNHNVGVMVVPMASSVGDWAAAAADSQKRLMDDAIDV